MSKEILVTNDKGVLFTVTKVDKGDKFGEGNKLVHTGNIPLVIFSDGNKEVATYDLETLEDVSKSGGLDLNASVDKWELSQENVKKVVSSFR